MKLATSEVMRRAFALSQINDSEAFDWEARINILNSEFAALWDFVCSHDEDFNLSVAVVTDTLPDDLYSIRRILNPVTFEELKRVRDGQSVDGQHYYTFNNKIKCGLPSVMIHYIKNPPTITYPNEIKQVGDAKIHRGTLVQLQIDNTYLITDLVTGKTRELEAQQNTLRWDVWNGKVVEMNGFGDLFIDGVQITTDIIDYIVNDFVYITTNLQEHYLIDFSYNLIPVEVYGHIIRDQYYMFNGQEIFWWTSTEWQPYIEAQDALFADPYIIFKRDNRWYYLLDEREFKLPDGEVVSASWDDRTGYGVILNDGTMHSLYPDTILDWPNSCYFDWLEAAIAVKCKIQIEQDPTGLMQLELEKKQRLEEFIRRNRKDAYRIPNPYAIRW